MWLAALVVLGFAARARAAVRLTRAADVCLRAPAVPLSRVFALMAWLRAPDASTTLLTLRAPPPARACVAVRLDVGGGGAAVVVETPSERLRAPLAGPPSGWAWLVVQHDGRRLELRWEPENDAETRVMAQFDVQCSGGGDVTLELPCRDELPASGELVVERLRLFKSAFGQGDLDALKSEPLDIDIPNCNTLGNWPLVDSLAGVEDVLGAERQNLINDGADEPLFDTGNLAPVVGPAAPAPLFCPIDECVHHVHCDSCQADGCTWCDKGDGGVSGAGGSCVGSAGCAFLETEVVNCPLFTPVGQFDVFDPLDVGSTSMATSSAASTPPAAATDAATGAAAVADRPVAASPGGPEAEGDASLPLPLLAAAALGGAVVCCGCLVASVACWRLQRQKKSISRHKKVYREAEEARQLDTVLPDAPRDPTVLGYATGAGYSGGGDTSRSASGTVASEPLTQGYVAPSTNTELDTGHEGFYSNGEGMETLEAPPVDYVELELKDAVEH